MEERYDLTALQLAILRVLWDRGEASVAEVHEELRDERGLALTTVGTLLSRLAKKGVVSYRVEGRQYLYRASITEGSVQRSMVEEIKERLFAGDTAAMVSKLLGAGAVSTEEIVKIRALLAAKERELKEGDD